MKRNKAVSFLRGKTFAAALVLCFVSAIAMVGMYQIGAENHVGDTAQSQKEEQIQKQKLAEMERETETAKAEEQQEEKEIVKTEPKAPAATPVPEETPAEPEEPVSQAELEDDYLTMEEETMEANTAAVIAKRETLSFSEDDTLLWPVAGNVIMDYSMDKSIYFSTLDQYKYNPAIVIGGAVGTSVLSAADGIVETIMVNEETGTTVTVELGNGYKAVYGQLKELAVEEDSIITEGQTIGYISEPTKYYTNEGSNLYFKLLKDGGPVDPMEYLQ